jgi:methylase of polypeptide subunit release factors
VSNSEITRLFTVLIRTSRPETASAISYLLSRFRLAKSSAFPQELNILDLCCGTGCISLLSAYSFPYRNTGVKELQVLGVDISSKAVALATQNQQNVLPDATSAIQRRTIANSTFIKADILLESSTDKDPREAAPLLDRLEQRAQLNWDLVISNPPYISPHAWNTSTTHSVRKFEPKIALVPPAPPSNTRISDEDQGDLFYPRLLQIADRVSAKILLMEVADMAQAERISTMVEESGIWDGVEIWCDEPSLADTHVMFGSIKVRGQGHGRSVFCWRGHGGPWLGLS